MRLCVLARVTAAHGTGGLQVHCQRLVEDLASRGHEVTLLTTGHPDGCRHERTGGVEVRYLAGTPPARYSGAWWSESARAVEELHATKAFDAILSEEIAGHAVARSGPRVPHYVFRQGIVLEHVVSEFHDADGLTGFGRYVAVKIPEMVYYTLRHEVPVLQRAQGVFVVSERLVRMHTRWLRVPASRVHVARNWVDCAQFRPDPERGERARIRLGIPPGRSVALMASVITRQKGVQVGLQALARCARAGTDVLGLVAGDGPYRRDLEREVSRLGLGHGVRFVGNIAGKEMPDYYNAADFFVFPSLRLEGVPYVLLEAMASGLPVVAPASGNLPEVLAGGRCGGLVKPGDVAGFAQAVEELARNATLRRELGSAARQRALASYSQEAVLPEILGVIEHPSGMRAP